MAREGRDVFTERLSKRLRNKQVTQNNDGADSLSLSTLLRWHLATPKYSSDRNAKR